MLKLDRASRSPLTNWWWTIERPLLGAIIGLMLIGVVMSLAASPPVAERIGLHSFYFVNRHLVFLLLGVCVMVACSCLPTVMARRLCFLGFLGGLFALVLVLLIGQEAKGATRWIHLPGFSLQPSELTKPFFVVVIAWVLTLRHTRERFPGFALAFGLLAVVIGLLIAQPDMGMSLAYAFTWGVMMFIAGLSLLFILALVVLGVSGITAGYFFLPHVKRRIDLFFDPSTGDNFQVAKSLNAFANGGVLGVGPGEGVVKENLPDAHTDFIFAVAGEELGLIVTLIIVALYAFILVRGFFSLKWERDLFKMYAVVGLLALFGFQATINMGVATSLLPNTGMTLPFISYGGSSMLGMAITMGLVLSFTRKTYGMREGG